MPILKFNPSGKTVEVPPGTEILEAARKCNITIDSPCGGKGTCGKCIVKVIDGSLNSDSLGILEEAFVSDGYVLACKSKISNQDVTIEIPERLGYAGGKFSDKVDDTGLIRQELLPQKWQYEPLTLKKFLQISEPKADDGLSDLDRITNALKKEYNKPEITYYFPLLKKIAGVLRENNGKITATLIKQENEIHIVDIESGDLTNSHLGIAVDVGTTTIAVELVDLHEAKVITVRSDYNDQISCGLDVISRINYSQKPDRLEELRMRVLGTINRLIYHVTESQGIKPTDICTAVLSGNTTMSHLLLGLNPEYIRLAPYTPTVLTVPYITAVDIGVNIKPGAWIYISPSVGSYVGGDITAGVLCTDLATDSEDVNLFIDIGTNGEIVVGSSSFLMSCACSAGPAFEGGEIECGMRAALGAIEKVEIDAETGLPTYYSIGEVKPKGICGSGMISLLAGLFLTGWIDPSGKLNRTKSCPAIKIEKRCAYYILADEKQSGTGKPVYINELDIENIIRAKGAIYSACALLIEQLGIDFNDLSHVYIAGGFGRFLDIEKAIILGLVPDLPKEKFKYIGNSSLIGSYMILVSHEYKEKQRELANRMTYIDLSNTPGYMDQYTASLFLPHTEISRFPNVEKQITNFRLR